MVPRQSSLTVRATRRSPMVRCRMVSGCARIGLVVRSNVMSRNQSNTAWDLLLDLDKQPPGPRHTRLAAAWRMAIRGGVLPAGSLLPPSRLLAADLGYSRWTVTEVYQQLVAEGYAHARVGSGTRVAALPGPLPQQAPEP